VALAGLAFFVGHVVLGVGGHAVAGAVNRWLYGGLEALAAVGCGLRAFGLRAERAAWLLLTAGIGAWTLGDIIFDFAYGAEPPFPSVADAFYLAFYPCCYVALALLVRERVSRFNRSLWLDGATAALASAALGAAVLFEVVLEHTHGSAAVVATNLAYPIGDLLLLALVVGVFAVTGWQPGRTWLLLGGAFALSATADGVFLYQTATDSYAEGTG